MRANQAVISGPVLGLAAAAAELPRVDLGYAIHEATSYNDTWDIYHFNNIRYAQEPPRWGLPSPPEGRDETIQKGMDARVCPQGSVDWMFVSSVYSQAWFFYDNATDFVYEDAVEATLPQTQARIQSELDEYGQTEDCLFLDVKVPRKVLESDKPAPVLLWIHGGGYVWSTKHSWEECPDPSGLLAASQADGSDGIIYVSINYRLGAFGFLSGQTLLDAGGVANVGLHDQRLAIQWVYDHIHLFNGDPEEITIGGVSAGGGSSMLHTIAHENREPLPFKRVFSESGGLQPINFAHAENQTLNFLDKANVTSIEEARELTTEQMITANLDVLLGQNETWYFGPTIDGDLIPEIFSQVLAKGQVVPGLDILMTHGKSEGGRFPAAWVQTKDQFRAYIRALMLYIKDDILEYFVNTLYTGVLPAKTMDVFGDIGLECYTDWVAKAYNNKVWQWEFAVGTQIFHSGDGPYIWAPTVNYTNLEPVPLVRDHVQGYITNFVKTGNPNGEGLTYFPQRGDNVTHLLFTEDGPSIGRDPTSGPTCDYLQQDLFN